LASPQTSGFCLFVIVASWGGGCLRLARLFVPIAGGAPSWSVLRRKKTHSLEWAFCIWGGGGLLV